MTTAWERYEVLSELYYRETGHMAPGKDSRTEDTSSQENRDRYEAWFCERALTAALNRIVEMEFKYE